MAMNAGGLIVGLGNPGPRYAHTRHNIGFLAVDHVLSLAAGRKTMRLEQAKRCPDYDLWSFCPVGAQGGTFLLAKPQTYMNLSGRAVAAICGSHGLSPDQVMVIHDELDLALGRMKLKQGGGGNGHNGIASIEECLGSPAFFRLRLGVGRPPSPQATPEGQPVVSVTDYVLSDFTPEEMGLIGQLLPAAWKGLDLFYRRGQGLAVQFLHAFRPEEPAHE